MLRSAFKSLKTQLAQIEAECQSQIAAGRKPSDANLEAAAESLDQLTQFLFAHDAETRPLNFLLADLWNLRRGAKPSAMLRPSTRRGRPPEGGIEDYLRGSLAAIAKFKQDMGASRKEACGWVARHMPAKLATALGSKPKTIDDWLLKWGGQSGFEIGPGRDGYTDMRASLEGQHLGDPKLIKGIKAISKFAENGGAI